MVECVGKIPFILDLALEREEGYLHTPAALSLIPIAWEAR
jgi:hypothetical protein